MAEHCPRNFFKGTALLGIFILGITLLHDRIGLDINRRLPLSSSEELSHTASDNTQVQISHMSSERLAIIMYIPNQMSYIHQFLGLIYGSWRFITDNLEKHFTVAQLRKALNVDLLVFCHPKICQQIPQECVNFPVDNHSKLEKKPPKHEIKNRTATCYRIPEPSEVDFPYPVLNSFIMFNRSDIPDILSAYTYVLRTDIDCYMTPEMLLWRPNRDLVVGKGGYCDPFNMKRLKNIAKKLNLTHRGVHCTGSTWYGKPEIFINVAQKTLTLTKYMYLNEFDPEAKGLETIDFKKNREGEWIRWWRPVSLLYGAELALNDAFRDFDQSYKAPLDASSCSTESVWKYPHVHCWHNPCEFSKFTFMDMLNKIISNQGQVPSSVAHKILENAQYKSIREMNLRDYCTYIAWNSAGRFMTHLLSQQ